MQSHTRTCIPLLSALATLAVLPASWAVQTCTQKFSGLQTCTLFNDQFASGGPTSLEATKRIEGELVAAYDRATQAQWVHKNDECKAMYLLYGCINAINHPDFPASAPCSSTGARLKGCKALCVKYYKTCITETKTDALIETTCAEQSAPPGDECFGDAGVLGMKSAAHDSLPPIFAVVFLALAVTLST
jgi:hypothetical protein